MADSTKVSGAQPANKAATLAPYGNAHSVAAEVSETKDAAAISDHDDVHLVRAMVMARE